MDIELIKVLGQFGMAGVMLGILGKVVWNVGLRMIKAIDQVGERADTAANRVGDKLDLHTKTDIAAWADVGIKIQDQFAESSEHMSDFKQQIMEEFATLRRDLAVLGTRLDVVIDQRAVPSSLEDDHSRRTRIPRVERHDFAPQSGTPVVDRPLNRRPRKGQEDDT